MNAGHAAAVHEILDLVNDAIKQTRQLAHSLDPTEVEVSGLITALKNLSVETSDVFPVKCQFRCGETQLPLPAQTNLALFRIAQEAIHNKDDLRPWAMITYSFQSFGLIEFLQVGRLGQLGDLAFAFFIDDNLLGRARS